MAEAQQVKLMSDYSAGWPLWSGREGRLATDTFPLSTSLATDLRSWQDLFEREFTWDDGWRTPEAEVRYARAAPGLLHSLRGELGPEVQITLDAWPVSDPELVAWLAQRQ